jgi:hypothetical protein
MKNLLLIITTLFCLSASAQVDKILIIEETNEILYVTYTKVDKQEYREFLPKSEFSVQLNALKTALSNDENIKNDMSKVTRSVYQNTLVSYTGSDRLTLNEPNNNQEYKLFNFETSTIQKVVELEVAIRNYLNNK